jgi:hypothetical protein
MSKYAERTTVDSDRSIAEIRKLLTRYGANKFISAHDLDELQATIAFQMRGRRIKFVIPLPDPNARDFTHTPQTRKPRTATAAQEAYEQAIRQRFRALALLVKAKLEAIDAGIVTFESEMLNKTMLPNGMTVEEWAEPQIEQAYLSGKMPPLLPDS